MFDSVDESTLNKIDRLGLAYCRLNSWQWDELLGPKPEGFDDLPNSRENNGPLFHRKSQSKRDYIRKPIDAIVSIIGRANASRCWWKFVLGKTEEEWFRWYLANGP